jgi:endoglucanase
LENFKIPIINNLPFHHQLPGKIEAEDFVQNMGLVLEETTDIGGGKNLGYTHRGDFLTYRIRVPSDGVYPVEVRVASNGTVGKLKLEQRTHDGAILEEVIITIPNTGGWQQWITLNDKIVLKAGSHLLRATIVEPEFNINWFRFLEATSITSAEESNSKYIQLHPNPASTFITIASTSTSSGPQLVSVYNAQGIRFKMMFTPLNNPIEVGDLSPGLYFIEVNDGQHVVREKFLKE